MIPSKERRRGIFVACKPRICRIDHSSLLDAMTEQQFLREEMNAYSWQLALMFSVAHI